MSGRGRSSVSFWSEFRRCTRWLYSLRQRRYTPTN